VSRPHTVSHTVPTPPTNYDDGRKTPLVSPQPLLYPHCHHLLTLTSVTIAKHFYRHYGFHRATFLTLCPCSSSLPLLLSSSFSLSLSPSLPLPLSFVLFCSQRMHDDIKLVDMHIDRTAVRPERVARADGRRPVRSGPVLPGCLFVWVCVWSVWSLSVCVCSCVFVAWSSAKPITIAPCIPS
jgi:hypothetical protein